MKVTVYSAIKHETSSRILPEVFSVVDANPRAVAIAMRVYRANARQATAKTKTRGEVTMTGKKVYKQKGTGGARHGSRRAPIFVGGGVTFGPHGNQNWSLVLPRRQRLRSLQQAFGLRSTETGMMIDLELAKGKTSTFAKAFDRIDSTAKTIVMILAPAERDLTLGMRNLKQVKICYADQINSYDIIKADKIILSEQAVDTIAARLARVKPETKKTETTAPKAAKKVAKKEPLVVEAETEVVVVKKVAAKKAATKVAATKVVKKAVKKSTTKKTKVA
ncbi:50S ribosomal protein L4 [Candidatus Woesebacteria bacterium]|nr:50S ribosomal protein L4 [Candidatus Woesebacteria bacterium]